MISDAESQARRLQAESEQRLREEIARLESNRSHLSHEVETMARQLETERERLRSALAEMLSWVDGNLQPVSSENVSSVTKITDAQRGPGSSGEVTQLRPSAASSGSSVSRVSLPQIR